MITPDRRLFAILLFTVFCVCGTPAEISSPEVVLTGSISSRSILKSELLLFTINITNKTSPEKAGSASLSNVTLARLPDSYSLKSICVLPDLPSSTERCQSAENFRAAGNRLMDSLVAGESITVRGYLCPDTLHKSASLSAVIEWTPQSATPAGKPGSSPPVPSAKAVSLGENQVQSSSWWGRLSIDEILKVLAIPGLLVVIGAVVGLIVNILNSNRDRRVHENEAQRSLRAETWKQMLPVSHNYAAKFYLPLSLAAEKFSKNLKQPNPRVAFFYLLYCGKKATATRNEIGGFYFKDLRGEFLAAQSWEQQRLACLGDEDTPFFLAVRASIDQLEDIDTYEAFESRFGDTPGGPFSDDSVQQAWMLFQNWTAQAAKVKKTISYIDSFTAVLDYESNRPYQYWYDASPRLTATEDTENTLRELLKAGKYNPAEIDDYLIAVVRP
jgi:hypothetical protein